MSKAILELRPPTLSSCVFYSSIAEQYFAVSIFPQYFSNDNNDNLTIEGGAVGGTYDGCSNSVVFWLIAVVLVIQQWRCATA